MSDRAILSTKTFAKQPVFSGTTIAKVSVVLIRELNTQESLELLSHSRLGRLACAHEGRPYIVPLYFAYDNDYLYSFSTFGQKIEWMRANPSVCVEVDEVVSPQQWISVIVFGQFEEMPDVPEWRRAREYTHKKLLERNAIWWEPAYSRTVLGNKERPLAPFFYRIHIAQITGRRACPEHETPPGRSLSTPGVNRARWLQKIMRSVRKQH